MGIGYDATQMSELDRHRRLHAVIASLGLPAVANSPDAAGGSVEEADTQRIATRQIDELLERVAAVTRVLSDGHQEWDDVDRLAAQVLLTDLAAIACTTRALNGLAATRLKGARADLAAARRDAERAIQETE